MTTSQWDPTKIRARAGKIFLLPNPYTPASPPASGATGATCSFATNVMTIVSAPTGGGFAVGQTITAAGVAYGTTILSLASGTANTIGATYTLSTSPGTISTESVSSTGGVAAILQAYLGNFYNDGNLQQALVANLAPWANLDAKGFDYDAKFKQIMFDPSVGLPINAGKYLESAVASCVIGDFSAAKFADLLSTTANETVSLAQSSTQAAKTAVLIGTTPYNTRYMCLYQWPSLDYLGNPIPDQYDNLFMPRVILDSDIKSVFVKNKPVDISVKITAEQDLWLQSPDSGMYVAAVYQETTKAHS